MLLTRQQLKAKKRNAKRLSQLLQDASRELEHNIIRLDDTVFDQGSWQLSDILPSQNAHSVIGEILAIADAWERLNHFEIEEKLAHIEGRFYQN